MSIEWKDKKPLRVERYKVTVTFPDGTKIDHHTPPGTLEDHVYQNENFSRVTIGLLDGAQITYNWNELRSVHVQKE